ncbi:unnamed protein product, partial [Durusdinium trenchii]
DEYKTLKPKKVAHNYGVPAKELFTYWQKEINCDKAVQSLPRALVMIVFFALMLMSHQMLGKAQSIEGAIRSDIEENANFAYNEIGTFGHKNINDVNSFADFYSWFRLGFAAIYMPQTKWVSESSKIHPAELTFEETQTYLELNRKLGPVKLSQQSAEVGECENFAFMGNLDPTFTPESCYHLGHEFYIQPSAFDLEFKGFKEDQNKTVWFPNDVDVTEWIEYLENTSWLTPRTDHWKITMVLYNPHYDIMTVTEIHFVLARSGKIWKEISFLSLKLEPYANRWTVVPEVFFYGCILSILVEQGRDVIGRLRTGHLHCRTFLWEYFNVWNLIDWISVTASCIYLGMWIKTNLDRGHLQESFEMVVEFCNSGDMERCLLGQGELFEMTKRVGMAAAWTNLAPWSPVSILSAFSCASSRPFRSSHAWRW